MGKNDLFTENMLYHLFPQLKPFLEGKQFANNVNLEKKSNFDI